MIPPVEFWFQLAGSFYVNLELALIYSQNKFYVLFSWDLSWICLWFVCGIFFPKKKRWLASNVCSPIIYMEMGWWSGRYDLGLARGKETVSLEGCSEQHSVVWKRAFIYSWKSLNCNFTLVSKASGHLKNIFLFFCREDISYSSLLFSTAWGRAAVSL